MNATRMAYEASMTPVHLPAKKTPSLRNGAGAENRTPLIGQAIRCPANRPRPQTPGAGGDNRNLFTGSEAQGTSYIPRPRNTCLNVKDLAGDSCRDTLIAPLATKEKASQVATQVPDKTKKEGGHFWWPPSSRNRNIISSRVRSPLARPDWRASAYLAVWFQNGSYVSRN